MAGTSTQGVHTFPRRAFPSRYWPLWFFPAPADFYRGPAVPVEGFAGGGESLTLTPGEDGLVLLVPALEPLSVGSPPVLPSMVRRMDTGWPLREIGVRAGYRVTSPLGTCNRARYTVEWRGLTRAERDELALWLRDEVEVSQQGGRFSFDLEPDGPGTGIVTVRPVANIPHAQISTGGVSSGGSVHAVESIECEEVFAPGSGGGGVGPGGSTVGGDGDISTPVPGGDIFDTSEGGIDFGEDGSIGIGTFSMASYDWQGVADSVGDSADFAGVIDGVETGADWGTVV